jgi:hypothetical protein
LHRLGARVREVTCHACSEVFVDPEPLGGRAWKVVVADDRGRVQYGTRRFFCSENCAKLGLDKHRGPRAAWIEGYEPIAKDMQ